MARLIITSKDVVIKEYVLAKEKNTVGRKSSNDIVLDDPTVSGVHAAFIHKIHTSVEDMKSTNGIKLNDILVDKHKLIHGDIVTIGEHDFKFIDEVVQNFESTVIIERPVKKDSESKGVISDKRKHSNKNKPESSAMIKPATINKPITKEKAVKKALKADVIVVDGQSIGKVIALNKPYTKVGSDNQFTVIARRKESYYLMPMNTGGEESAPKFNGKQISAESILLSDGDIIEIASIQLKFRLGK